MHSVLNEYDKLKTVDWYLYFKDELSEYFYNYNGDTREDSFLKRRELIVKTLVKAIKNKEIVIGAHGENFDIERKKIDTIVVHMTGSSSKKDEKRDIDYLNALDLIRLYCPIYSEQNRQYYTKAIYSGHFYRESQTFIPYHYLVDSDGSFENILKDEYIGWHAGNWDINCRSIAIAFLGNFLDSSPSKMALESARNIIKKYKDVKILAHKEVNSITKCPGDKFSLWKDKLI